MILVRNLLQPLSGSKTIFYIVILGLTFSSCDLFKKIQDDDDTAVETGDELEPIQGRKVYDPETGTWVIVEEAVTEKMDTVAWREIPTSDDPPITATGESPVSGSASNVIDVTDFGSQLLNIYNVSVVLPFLTDRFSPLDAGIYPNSLWALNYYAGTQMALEVLDNEGVKLNVSVMDSGASAGTTSSLIRTSSDLTESHLIIGPYRRDNVALLAQMAKQRGSVLVSPQSAASGISSLNPNYVQVNPTLETHSEAILQHALTHHHSKNIVLVSKDNPNEVSRLTYFRDEYNRYNRGRPVAPLQELLIPESEATSMENVDFTPIMQQSDTTVFIVPNWEETFVYALLRKIDVSRDPYETVVVYGMPQWKDFEKIDFDYYEKLQVHISSSVFVNPLDPDVRLFKQQFYDLYGAIPTDEAFVGYDVMLYFGRMLKKYGTKFQYALEGAEEEGLHTTFEFERVVRPGTTSGIETNEIEQFENKYVNILMFKNYQFQKALE
ncbi:MAG: ABC transporter substrate-binding protein [Saprospiraceae bacterium]|nr:amino acid ABC transporter substrate-binding protein [Lewinella sp.]